MAMKSKKAKLKENKARKKLNAGKRAADHKSGNRYLKLPDGARFWATKKVDEEVTIDVIPFTVTKESRKFAKNDYDVGELNFERTYYVHSFCVGPGQDSVICAAKTFGKKCYVCEWMNKHPLPMDASKEEKDARYKFVPKIRQLWNVRVQGDEDKGCQVFDVSVKLFGETLFTKIAGAKGKRKEKFENFADPDDGSSIIITPKNKSMGSGNPFVTYETLDIVDRENEVGAEWVAKAHDLDAMIPVPDYEKVKEMMLAGGSEKDEEDPDAADDDGDDELPEAPCEKGDQIEFKHKGKTKKGKCVKVDEEEVEVSVKLADGTILKIDFDDVILPEAEEDDDEDEDQDGEGDEGGEEDDDEGDDEDLESDDDDEEGDDPDEDDEEADEDEDDEEVEIVKGMRVEWDSPKSGKHLTGTVKSTPKNGECLVEYSKTKPSIVVDVDILSPVAEEEDDEDEEEIETLSAKKKPAGKKRREVIDEDDD